MNSKTQIQCPPERALRSVYIVRQAKFLARCHLDCGNSIGGLQK